MDSLHPDCEPFAGGWLAVGHGHEIWVEQCGKPAGIPVLFLHGGPGSGCSPVHRRLFDPERYRAILIDQRGCGRSRPLGALQHNTTAHLIDDLEKVRVALGIEKWLVWGGSWGSLLAIAYAQRHPAVISGLLLRGLFMGSRAEISQYLESAEYPDAARKRLLSQAATILGDDQQAAEAAGCDWLNHERRLMGEAPLCKPLTAAQRAKVCIQMHYLQADCFLPQNRLWQAVDRIRAIPTYLVQGLADSICPPATAIRLYGLWPELRFIGLPESGHNGLAPEMAAACIKALACLAGECD